jgi:hypothetical protein
MKIVEVQSLTWGRDYGPGWVGFVGHHSLLARAINWFTRWWRHDGEPSVSHTFLVTGPDECIEANAGGIERSGLAQYLADPRYRVYFRQPRGWTPEMGARLAAAAEPYIGYDYDFDLLFADALSYSVIGRRVNGLSKNELDEWITHLAESPRETICSGVVSLALQSQPELAGRGSLRLPARENNPQMLFSDEEVFEPQVTMICGANPKSENRNPKEIRNPKTEN